MHGLKIWMPLYVGDYLADTRKLSIPQHGAYLLLIMEYWRNGPLPNDDAELIAILQTDKKTWERDLKQRVRSFFVVGEDGLLHQKRIDQERAKASENIAKKRGAAHARWGQSTSESNADAMHVHCKSNPLARATPSPSQSERKKEPASQDADARDATARAKRVPHRTRIAEDWSPNQTGMTSALSYGVDVRTELPKFRDFHVGRGTLAADWEATWRVWCGNAKKFSGGGGRGPRPTATSTWDAVLGPANGSKFTGWGADPDQTQVPDYIEGELS